MLRRARRRPPLRLVVAIVVAAMLAGAVIAVAFGGGDPSPKGVRVQFLGGPAQDAGRTPGQPPASQATSSPLTETPTPPAAVTGFTWPIAGGCLPVDDSLMPGAPRAYRNGVHEGVDFYNADNCTEIDVGTEVLAAKTGTVVRADWDYQDLTAEELNALEEDVQGGQANAAEVLDAFRGRQVWVDHGDGTLTRYCHLSGIAEGIEVGDSVAQGQLIAYVGESGTPESVSNPGTEYHLHFELRVGDHYLGQGLSPDETRALYQEAFAP